MNQKIVLSDDLQLDLASAISECEHDRIFVVTDATTARCCWPTIEQYHGLRNARLIVIPATDAHKDLASVVQIWQALENGQATRHSCLINLGGGMVTDLGGFAASTFKRGIHFINIPTTLLAMVDAAVGGKTGINFDGLKNEIGVFSDAQFVILHAPFLQTLDAENLHSGYAEMLKHGLISHERMLAQLLRFRLDGTVDLGALQRMIGESVDVKKRIVDSDPHERGMRKALNLGHTLGHAFESWALRRRPILHGYAVAYGLVAELYLSVVRCGFPTEKMRQVVGFVNEHYGRLPITCNDYAELTALMRHDKKNRDGLINFTLLADVGHVRIDQTATDREINEALDFYREG